MLAPLFLLSVCAADLTPIYHQDFEALGALQSFGGSAGSLGDGFHGGRALWIENPDPKASVNRTFRLPVEQLAGQRVALSAAVKAENVGDRPNNWNGVKVMLILETAEGKQHPQLHLATGSYDWTEQSVALRLPKGLTRATLVLGLELVSGTVGFDDVDLRIGVQRPGRRSAARYQSHPEPRLRGAMYGPTCRPGDLQTFGQEWGANHIRFQLNWTPMKASDTAAADLDAFDKWLDGALPECDKALADCEKYGLRALVDLHTAPGGRSEGGVCRMFRDRAAQDRLVAAWDKIAGRYKGRQVVWAYELLNEPVEPPPGPGVTSWRAIATRAAQAIRAVEPDKPIVVEPGPWGSPQGFDQFQPLDMEGIVYSFHFYLPFTFTHQGVYPDKPPVVYPGVIEGERWDKERLREAMRPVADFEEYYNVPIYIGEFSAARWAADGSAYRWLKDVIEVFEEHAWDWSYHAYREWDGWSVEHGTDKTDRQRSAVPTDREELLRGWFEQNAKPER